MVDASQLIPDVFDYVPWERLDETDWSAIIDRLLDRLNGLDRDWEVTFLVRGINPRGAVWRSGPVRFYDPKGYSFDPGRWLHASAGDNNEAVAATVAVSARTVSVAKKRGRVVLDAALDAFSFALSTNRDAGGLRPEVHVESRAVDMATEAWTFGGALTRHQMATPVSANEAKFNDLGEFYAPLVKKAATADLGTASGGLNELQRRVVRALHWYRLGRWEANPLERFLFYWIAVEQLIAEGDAQKGEALFGPLVDLLVTWQECPGLAGIGHERNEIVQLLGESEEFRSCVEAEPLLTQWREDFRVLLDPSNTSTLRKCAAVLDSGQRSVVEGFASLIEDRWANRSAIADSVALVEGRSGSKSTCSIVCETRSPTRVCYTDPI